MMMSAAKQTPTVICLMGPTASGKTALAVELVKHFNCEIISVDSAMIYKGMDIGTAKPDAEILKQAPHRLIDILDPSENYSAGQFRQDALREIKAILAIGKIPLLVGGTMLYFKVLQENIADFPEIPQEIRHKIHDEAEKYGLDYLYERLKTIDPISAQKIHPHDPQRISRALEVYEATGKTLAEFIKQQNSENLPFHFINIALIPNDRAILHQHIEARFHEMLEQGFVAEVTTLYQRGDLNPNMPSLRSVGYRQVWQYLAGELPYAEMVLRSIYATRQLAKRQLTWLRSWKNLSVFDSADTELLTKVTAKLSSRAQRGISS